MAYDQWKTTEPEEDPVWVQKGYRNLNEYFTAVELGIEDVKEFEDE